MTTLFAFLHHLAAFTLVSVMTLEFVLLRQELNIANARRILLADTIYGISAAALIIVGILRMFYFEKGAYYYFHNVPFIAKLALLASVGLLSIYPTVEFLSWRKALKNKDLPQAAAAKLRKVRLVIHLELMGIVLILLCAAMAARGIGLFGT